MLEQYLPILLFILLGMLFGLAPVTLSSLISLALGTKQPSAAKLSRYECGFPAFGDARMKFDIRYYLVALLFILFDLEVAFCVPWAVIMRDLPWAGYIAMAIFLGLLTIGFVYEWKKGALDWE